MNKRMVTVFVAALVLLSGAVHAEVVRVTRFANPGTAFSLPALKSQNEARAMLEKRKEDVRIVLRDAGWAGNMDDLLRAAETGTFTESTLAPGTEIPYVAMRRNGKPGVLRNVLWAGREPVPLYMLEFQSGGRRYRLVVPKPCSNLWVEDLGPVAPSAPPALPVSVQVSSTEVCATQPAAITVQVANASSAQVVLLVNGAQAASGTAVNGVYRAELPGVAEPGSYEVVATVGGVQGTGRVSVVACPPSCALTATPAETRSGGEIVVDASGSRVDPRVPGAVKQVNVSVSRNGEAQGTLTLTPTGFTGNVRYKKDGTYTFHATAVDDAGQSSTNTCEAVVTVTKPPMSFFLDGLVGKERMVREEYGGGRCAALLGVKFGILPRLGKHAELEAAVGGKLNLRDSDNSAIFADLAVHGVFARAFLGGGVSFWDLNLDETRAVALLLDGGVGLSDSGRLQLVLEGRIPFDQFDDASNNYQFWGGLRIRF